jgi:hypothetical protein
MDFFIPFALSCIQAPRLCGYGSILQQDYWSDVWYNRPYVNVGMSFGNKNPFGLVKYNIWIF